MMGVSGRGLAAEVDPKSNLARVSDSFERAVGIGSDNIERRPNSLSLPNTAGLADLFDPFICSSL